MTSPRIAQRCKHTEGSRNVVPPHQEIEIEHGAHCGFAIDRLRQGGALKQDNGHAFRRQAVENVLKFMKEERVAADVPVIDGLEGLLHCPRN